MALSRHNLETIARQELIRDGISFDGLPDRSKMMLVAAAETADRMRQDPRAAVRECWREIVELIRHDGPNEPQGPHG